MTHQTQPTTPTPDKLVHALEDLKQFDPDAHQAAHAVLARKWHDEPSKPSTGVTWADMSHVLGPIAWDWPGWLPSGLLTILAGESGSGKSALALRVAGCFLCGDPWPDGTPYTGDRGKVLWCESEAAQAINLERAKNWNLPMHRLLTPLDNPLDDVQLDNPDHKAAMIYWAGRADVRLVIIDSLRGSHRRDENSSELVAIIKWLAELARDTGKPLILTHHLRKRGVLDAGQRVNLERLRGSSAIVQTARVVWAIDTPDPANEGTKRLSVIKNNLARFPEPIGLTMSDLGLSFVDAPEPPKRTTLADQAKDALKELLGDGPMAYSDLIGELAGMGISERTARRAKDTMGIVSKKEPDGWHWALPYSNN